MDVQFMNKHEPLRMLLRMNMLHYLESITGITHHNSMTQRLGRCRWSRSTASVSPGFLFASHLPAPSDAAWGLTNWTVDGDLGWVAGRLGP